MQISGSELPKNQWSSFYGKLGKEVGSRRHKLSDFIYKFCRDGQLFQVCTQRWVIAYKTAATSRIHNFIVQNHGFIDPFWEFGYQTTQKIILF
jgi:hypothetical protein